MKIFNLVILGIFFFAAISFAAECTEHFSWLPNSEKDLAGYRIYYSQNAEELLNADKNSTLHVDITDIVSVNTEGRIEGEVSGLESGKTYYFVCRAYNTAGLESVNSDQVVTVAGGNLPPVPTQDMPAPRIINMYQN